MYNLRFIKISDKIDDFAVLNYGYRVIDYYYLIIRQSRLSDFIIMLNLICEK